VKKLEATLFSGGSSIVLKNENERSKGIGGLEEIVLNGNARKKKIMNGLWAG
jgi:hypothetical protein